MFFIGNKINNQMRKIAQSVTTTRQIDENEMKSYLTQDYKSDIKEKYFIRNTKININESINVEFKHFRPQCDKNGFKLLVLHTIDKYCNAFWNAGKQGGTIYFGIEDDGTVIGTDTLNDELIDFLQCRMVQLIDKWHIYNGNNENDDLFPLMRLNLTKNLNGLKEIKHKLHQYIEFNFIQIIDSDGYIAPNSRVIAVTVKQPFVCQNGKKIQFYDSNNVAWLKTQAAVKWLHTRCIDNDIHIQLQHKQDIANGQHIQDIQDIQEVDDKVTINIIPNFGVNSDEGEGESKCNDAKQVQPDLIKFIKQNRDTKVEICNKTVTVNHENSEVSSLSSLPF